jgi:hypothetical protein
MNSLRQPTSLLLDSSSYSSSYTATSVSRLGTSPPKENHHNTDNKSGTISSQLSPSTAQHTFSHSSAPPSKLSMPKQSLPSSPTRQSGSRSQAKCPGRPASMYSFAFGHFQAYIHTVCIPSQSAPCLHPEKWSSSFHLTEASLPV